MGFPVNHCIFFTHILLDQYLTGILSEIGQKVLQTHPRRGGIRWGVSGKNFQNFFKLNNPGVRGRACPAEGSGDLDCAKIAL
jgi:hypothetical protein